MRSSVAASVWWFRFWKAQSSRPFLSLGLAIKEHGWTTLLPGIQITSRSVLFCFCCTPKWKHLRERGDNGQLIKLPNRQRFPFSTLGITFCGIPLRNWHPINLNKYAQKHNSTTGWRHIGYGARITHPKNVWFVGGVCARKGNYVCSQSKNAIFRLPVLIIVWLMFSFHAKKTCKPHVCAGRKHLQIGLVIKSTAFQCYRGPYFHLNVQINAARWRCQQALSSSWTLRSPDTQILRKTPQCRTSRESEPGVWYAAALRRGERHWSVTAKRMTVFQRCWWSFFRRCSEDHTRRCGSSPPPHWWLGETYIFLGLHKDTSPESSKTWASGATEQTDKGGRSTFCR